MTLTDLFCHVIRIMLILHSIVVWIVGGCCACVRVFFVCCCWRRGLFSQLVHFVQNSIKTNVCCPMCTVWTCNSFDYDMAGKMANDNDDDDGKLSIAWKTMFIFNKFDMLQATPSAFCHRPLHACMCGCVCLRGAILQIKSMSPRYTRTERKTNGKCV